MIREPESISITKRAKQIPNSIILSIGDVHFNTSHEIVNFVCEKLKDGWTHYISSDGLEELRNKIIEVKKYKNYSPDNLIITPGAKQAIFYVLKAIDLNKVYTLEPTWLGYKYTVDLLGKEYNGINIYDEYWLDNLKKKDFDVLIINNPNNPNGKILNNEEMKQIVDICKDKQAYLISDEIYDVYDYNGNYCSYCNFDYDKIVIINGFSKSFAMTGWRIGYILTRNETLYRLISIINQNIATCVSTASQFAALKALETSKNEEYSKYYYENYKLILDNFPEQNEILCGGIYTFIDLEHYNIRLDGVKFSEELLNKKNVAVVPGEAYGQNFRNYIRVAFAVSKEKLTLGVNRIKEYISEVKGHDII